MQSNLGRMTSTRWPTSCTARPSAVTTSPMPPTCIEQVLALRPRWDMQWAAATAARDQGMKPPRAQHLGRVTSMNGGKGSSDVCSLALQCCSQVGAACHHVAMLVENNRNHTTSATQLGPATLSFCIAVNPYEPNVISARTAPQAHSSTLQQCSCQAGASPLQLAPSRMTEERNISST